MRILIIGDGAAGLATSIAAQIIGPCEIIAVQDEPSEAKEEFELHPIKIDIEDILIKPSLNFSQPTGRAAQRRRTRNH